MKKHVVRLYGSDLTIFYTTSGMKETLRHFNSEGDIAEGTAAIVENTEAVDHIGPAAVGIGPADVGTGLVAAVGDKEMRAVEYMGREAEENRMDFVDKVTADLADVHNKAKGPVDTEHFEAAAVQQKQ